MSVAEGTNSAGITARILGVAARQREISLVVVMVVLGGLVAIQAPQFLSASNLTAVLVLSSIIAIAAVGEALVVITRNVDLSVEAMMGLVAFTVADVLKLHVMGVPEAMVCGVALGLVLGMFNGVLVAYVRIPSIVATLGTLSIFRGLAFLAAGGKRVSLPDLPAGYTDPAVQLVLGVPLFLVIAVVVVVVVGLFMRQTQAGRQVYAVGSNPEAAEIQGIRTRRVEFGVFAICGLLSGVAGILWGIEFGTIDATSATGVTLQVVAAVVVGGVSISGGSGTVVGAALGAIFLGFISNALILLRLSQFWLQAVYGVVILAAVTLDAFVLRRLRRSSQGRRAR